MFPAQARLPWITFVTTSLPSVSSTVLLLKFTAPLTVLRMKPLPEPVVPVHGHRAVDPVVLERVPRDVERAA